MAEDCATCGDNGGSPESKESNEFLYLQLDVPRGHGSMLIPSYGGNIPMSITGKPDSTFTLEIEDDSGCSILKSPLKDIVIPSNGKYTFNQKFPAVISSKKEYTLKLSENLNISREAPWNDLNHYIIPQYPNPTITFTQSSDSGAATNPQTLTLAGDDITVTGTAFERISTITTKTLVWNSKFKRYENKTTITPGTKDISWTATETGDYIGNLYISRQPNESDISNSGTYTRTVNKKVKGSEIELSEGTTDITDDMLGHVTSKLTKTVIKNIGVESCYQNTNEFELNNVLNLLPEMVVEIPNNPNNVLSHVNLTERIITISNELNIKEGTELTFSYSGGIAVEKIKDHHSILTRSTPPIHKGATVEFSKARAQTSTTLVATGSGSSTVTIAGTFLVDRFENEDEVYTLNVDNFITNTPNAYDQDIYTAKDTAAIINMILHDIDLNASDKTCTVISGPSHGSLSEVGEFSIITYTPHTGYIGEDKFTFTMRDAANASAEKTIYITVT